MKKGDRKEERREGGKGGRERRRKRRIFLGVYGPLIQAQGCD